MISCVRVTRVVDIFRPDRNDNVCARSQSWHKSDVRPHFEIRDGLYTGRSLPKTSKRSSTNTLISEKDYTLEGHHPKTSKRSSTNMLSSFL